MQIKFKQTPNFYKLYELKAVVLHITVGSYQSAIDWLTNPRSNASAHFVVSRKGALTQLASLDVGTWHAGRVHNPNERAKKVLPKDIFGRLKNPNHYTIGIEFEGYFDYNKDGIVSEKEKQYTQAQINAAVFLIRDYIPSQTGKIFKEEEILIHKDITSYKPDLNPSREKIVQKLFKKETAKEKVKKLAEELYKASRKL